MGEKVRLIGTLTEAPVVLPRRAPNGEAASVLGAARAAPLRRDGPEKLTGEARYTDDLVFPGAWHGATVRSTEARARLLGVELDPAFDWSTVVVLTAADIPGRNLVNGIQPDQPALAEGEIRHRAEPVALLAAPDRELLAEAHRHVQVRTEPLPPVLDPLLSERSFAGYEIARGDVEAALAAADLVIEGEYRVGHQEQLYIENQAMIALPRPDGGVTVIGSLQCPYYVHAALRLALGLSETQAVVVQAETGGAFGGKEEYPSVLAIHAALLAQRVGRPVRMIYDRHEDISATTKRHPAILRHRTGVSRDGRLLAQDIELVYDGGAYCTLSPVVLSRGTLHAGGPYACPNVRVRSRVMATNTPPNGAFRGFGAPQAHVAAELQAARVAEALGTSPAELRRRWAYRVGDVTPTGQVLRESVGALEVLERAVEASEYERVRERTATARQERQAREVAESWRTMANAGGHTAATEGGGPGRPATSPVAVGPERRASGIGLAMGWHGAGFTGSGEVHLASVAAVELAADGRVMVLAASTEMGQGARTVLPMLAAEALGIPLEAVEMAAVDTSVVPNSGPTVASRTTMVVGGLVVRAAARLRTQVEERTGRPFAQSYLDFASEHGPVRVDQAFEPYPGVSFDDSTYSGDAYPAFGWAAAVAEVEIDLDTGEVHVTSVVSADDVGRVVHQALAEGQVEGGTLQSVGYATIEEVKLDEGRYLNDRLATYLVPTAMDAPRITAILVEEPFSGEPHGAKGLGELPMNVAAPAVIDAIHDAVGAWITHLPATAERVLEALGVTSAPPADGQGQP